MPRVAAGLAIALFLSQAFMGFIARAIVERDAAHGRYSISLIIDDVDGTTRRAVSCGGGSLTRSSSNRRVWAVAAIRERRSVPSRQRRQALMAQTRMRPGPEANQHRVRNATHSESWARLARCGMERLLYVGIGRLLLGDRTAEFSAIRLWTTSSPL